jgi:hypothetical protein
VPRRRDRPRETKVRLPYAMIARSARQVRSFKAQRMGAGKDRLLRLTDRFAVSVCKWYIQTEPEHVSVWPTSSRLRC